MSWSGSFHWSLGMVALHTASPHHPSVGVSGQGSWSSLQTSPASAERYSPLWTLWCLGYLAWRPVQQDPTSRWPSGSHRYLEPNECIYAANFWKGKQEVHVWKELHLTQTHLPGGSLQTDHRNQRKHPACAVYGLWALESPALGHPVKQLFLSLYLND